MAGEHDVVILDEINNALAIDKFPIDDVLPLQEVIDVIKNRPHGMHLVLTGTDAKPEITELDDLVSEVVAHRHIHDDGIPAVTGQEIKIVIEVHGFHVETSICIS